MWPRSFRTWASSTDKGENGRPAENSEPEGKELMEEQTREIVTSYFRLVNEEKFDEFFALFHPDIEMNAPFGFSARGLDEVKPFYLRVPKNYPDHVDTPEIILVSGNRAAVFIDFTGKTRKGIPVAFKASDWFEIEDGKIRSLNIFFDSDGISKRLAKLSGAK